MLNYQRVAQYENEMMGKHTDTDTSRRWKYWPFVHRPSICDKANHWFLYTSLFRHVIWDQHASIISGWWKELETPHQILAIESNVASNAPLNSPFRTFPVQIWAVHICWTSRKAYAHFMFGGLSTALLVKKRVKSRKPLQLAKTRQNPHVSWLTKLLTHFEWLKVKTCQKLTESLKFIA